MENWIPAITTTSALAVLAFLFRSLIITRLRSSVQHEFNSKIEVVRAEIRSKESEIDSLRSGAMSGLITRQAALYQRKLAAIDQIWASVKELEKGKYVSHMFGTLNVDACLKASGKDPNFNDFIEAVGGGVKTADLDLEGAKLARPFLTPLAWAYYSAYCAVIMQALIIRDTLKIGVQDAAKFINFENTSNLLKTTLPSWSGFIDEFGIAGHHHLLDEIEKLLLAELKNIQNGLEDDKENTERAARIHEGVQKVTGDIEDMRARA